MLVTFYAACCVLCFFMRPKVTFINKALICEHSMFLLNMCCFLYMLCVNYIMNVMRLNFTQNLDLK